MYDATCIAACVAAIAATAAPMSRDSAKASELQFDGAVIGMPFDAWRASVTDRSDASPAQVACDGPADWRVCRFQAQYGAFDVPTSLRLVGPYRARAPTFVFDHGRLSEIRFRSSADAFNEVVRWLQSRYGASARTLHEDVRLGRLDLPRVRKVWDLPGGRVELISPATNPTQLEVRMGRGGAASGEPSGARPTDADAGRPA